MLNKLKKLLEGSYMSWEDYKGMIDKRDMIIFRHRTANESVDNLLSRTILSDGVLR